MSVEALSLQAPRLLEDLDVLLAQHVLIGLMVQRWHVLDAGIRRLEQTVHLIVTYVLARQLLYCDAVHRLFLVRVER